MMQIHRLKTWPSHFEAVKDGRKPFEIRYGGDRDFAVGDLLVLEAWDPATEEYDEDEEPLVRKVTHVLDSRWGLIDDYVAMGLAPVADETYCAAIDNMPERTSPRASEAKGEP